MYCRFLQRESGAKHIVRIQQKSQSILTVNCNSRLIYIYIYIYIYMCVCVFLGGGLNSNFKVGYYSRNCCDACLLTNISKTFLMHCSGKVTMITTPNIIHMFIVFSQITKTSDVLAQK